jgi:hypothetical protein
MVTDGISPDLIQKIATEISLPLSHIFSLILQSGICPKESKLVGLSLYSRRETQNYSTITVQLLY